MVNPGSFNQTGASIRVVDIDGSPWFVAKDICLALGAYLRAEGRPNVARAVNGVDKEEVKTFNLIDAKGRFQNTSIISESGLYKLILRSTVPLAKPFQDWVTRDVLPAIRKDGVNPFYLIVIMGTLNTSSDNE